MTIFLVILGILLFIGLVVLHEWGHFIMARRNGVEVEEFGIGFPPQLWKKRMRGGYDFTINLLPLGGFVKLKGEHDSDDTKGSFGAASLKAKTKIMLAGVALNLLAALAIFTVIAWVGMPRLVTPERFGEEQFTVGGDTRIIDSTLRVADVSKDSPADKSGVKAGDAIVAIAGVRESASGSTPCEQLTNQGVALNCAEHPTDFITGDLFRAVARSKAGQELPMEIRRESGEIVSISPTLLSTEEVEASRNTDNPKGYFGFVPFDYQVRRSTWSAPVVAVGFSAQLTKLTFKALGQALDGLGGIIAGAVTGNTAARQNGQTVASEQVSGPLGIAYALKTGAAQGIVFIMFIIGLLSLTLAIMNVLPIPALDGGRFYLMAFSRLVLKRPLTQKVEERVVGTSFLVLMALFVVITYVDAKRIF